MPRSDGRRHFSNFLLFFLFLVVWSKQDLDGLQSNMRFVQCGAAEGRAGYLILNNQKRVIIGISRGRIAVPERQKDAYLGLLKKQPSTSSKAYFREVDCIVKRWQPLRAEGRYGSKRHGR